MLARQSLLQPARVGQHSTCRAWPILHYGGMQDRSAPCRQPATLPPGYALTLSTCRALPVLSPCPDHHHHGAALLSCRGIWRNSLLFSPTTKYGTYSYADVMVKPLAEAMRDALAATAKIGKLYTPPEAERPVVYMALQGEQLQGRAQHGPPVLAAQDPAAVLQHTAYVTQNATCRHSACPHILQSFAFKHAAHMRLGAKLQHLHPSQLQLQGMPCSRMVIRPVMLPGWC